MSKIQFVRRWRETLKLSKRCKSLQWSFRTIKGNAGVRKHIHINISTKYLAFRRKWTKTPFRRNAAEISKGYCFHVCEISVISVSRYRWTKTKVRKTIVAAVKPRCRLWKTNQDHFDLILISIIAFTQLNNILKHGQNTTGWPGPRNIPH